MKKVAKIVVGIFLVIVVLIGGGIAYMFMNTNNSVKDHKMSQVKLLEHRNGKGQGAEVIVGDMVKKNMLRWML